MRRADSLENTLMLGKTEGRRRRGRQRTRWLDGITDSTDASFNKLWERVKAGKVAEKALVSADITANKNMVPFDSRSAFQTSGIRLGTPAITTRGVKEDMMPFIAEMIETVLNSPEDEKVIAAVRSKVNETMAEYPLFAY